MRPQTMRMATALTAVAAIAIPAGALAGVGPAANGAHSAGSHTVVLKNIRFNPGTLSIRRGESVTWSWRDGSIEHNVTGNGFRSRTQTHGSFTVRFARSGTYRYRCTIHVSEGMKGTIVVH
jgi:plastocyanin